MIASNSRRASTDKKKIGVLVAVGIIAIIAVSAQTTLISSDESAAPQDDNPAVASPVRTAADLATATESFTLTLVDLPPLPPAHAEFVGQDTYVTAYASLGELPPGAFILGGTEKYETAAGSLPVLAAGFYEAGSSAEYEKAGATRVLPTAGFQPAGQESYERAIDGLLALPQATVYIP